MKKFFILIPVYNDWESLLKLLFEINSSIQGIKNSEFKCIIINDASTEAIPDIKVPSNISSIKLINMKENRGHARCNAFGLKYISSLDDYDYVILMDGDGEDRPEELKLLIDKAINDEKKSVVAKRVKRSEGVFFQLLYQIHKIITIVFTGKNINFGNYSCLTKNDVEILSSKSSLWSSFSGSLKYHVSQLNSVNSIRGLRYVGPSKMSLLNLVIHSFSIIAVFKKTVFLRSAIIIIVASYFTPKFGMAVISAQILLVIFNLMIFIVSLRENEKNFKNADLNKESSNLFTH